MRHNNSYVAIFAIIVASLLAWGCSDDTGVNSVGAETENLDFPVPETQQMEADLDRQASEMEAQFAKSATWNTIDGPTTITEPGFYRVTRNFSATEDAIVIQSDDVYLHLGGRRITGPGNKEGRGVVVDGASNVYINGGKLETFGIGVQLIDASHCWVFGVKVTGGDEFADPANGIAPQIGIMALNSYGNLIFNNKLDLINLGIFMRGGGTFHNTLYRNHVTGGDNGLLGICYNPDGSGDPAGAHDDLILRNFLKRFGAGIQFNTTSDNNRFYANLVWYFNAAWEDLNGDNEFAFNRTHQIGGPSMAKSAPEFEESRF